MKIINYVFIFILSCCVSCIAEENFNDWLNSFSLKAKNEGVSQSTINNVLIENNSLASNKMVYYPFLFLLIYLIVSILIGLYSYLDKLDRAS